MQQRRERAEPVCQVAAVVVVCRDRKVEVTVIAETAPSLSLRCRLTRKELEFSAGIVCYLRCIPRVLFEVYTP